MSVSCNTQHKMLLGPCLRAAIFSGVLAHFSSATIQGTQKEGCTTTLNSERWHSEKLCATIKKGKTRGCTFRLMFSMPVCVLAKWPTSGEGGKEEPQGATHASDMSSHGQRR